DRHTPVPVARDHAQRRVEELLATLARRQTGRVGAAGSARHGRQGARRHPHATRYSVCVERGQLSMRPAKKTIERLRERARLLGEKHTTLAERYVEEGVLMDEHPSIH